jgi:pyruvate,water dikinase
MKHARRNAIKVFERIELPRFCEYVDEKCEQDLSELTTQDLVAELHNRIQRVLTDFGKESLKPGFFAGSARLELEARLTQLLGQVRGEQLTQALTSGLNGDTTVEQNTMLFRVSQGTETMDAFLQSYGHRCAGEMELANPRWQEDNAYLRQIVDQQETSQANSPEALHQRSQERRDQAMRELPDVLIDWGGSFMREDIELLAVEAQELLPCRESGKHYLMMGYALIRTVILELGRRWKLDDGIFFLQLDELDGVENVSDSLVQKIAKRRVRWQSAQRLDLPDVISSDNLDELGLPRQIDTSSELEAQSLSPGVVTGTAQVILNPSDATDLGDDCILICPSTDPGWTALFTTIKGLVVERGGVLSHGAITARDFGIPAVACPDATQTIRRGAKVRVDGDRGHISIIEDK